jgi:PAS domain S-box-containing protein
VNELHKPLVPPRGLFASGKFDQYKRDIPYATLAQAFQSLVRPLLSKSEEELSRWRDALREALDPNGLLIVDLVPELKHIIGEQPPVPQLPPQDAQGRFQLVLRRFISVFARLEHPLALFLDDLQWLDAATLDLLEDLLTRTDLRHLLLIGAYRDNEVSATHPLLRKLNAIRQAGGVLQHIVLGPLGRDDLAQLLADSLHCDSERAAPLAQLIHEKTTGNPFFAIQFISTLAEEGLLAFDYHDGLWSWDLSQIDAKHYTDNVVELMVEKLNRLPVRMQEALQQFACIGNSAEFEVLRMVWQISSEELHQHLWEAVRTGLIFRAEISYRFLHDRVQEAAYSLIPQELRAAVHLRIGTLLAAQTPPEKLEESIFEIVNQLNRGSHLLTSTEERERVAKLNLIAGRRAKLATAYASALKYLQAGGTLLTHKTWESSYELVFSIEYLMAECELMTADMAAAENRLARLAQRARNRHDNCVVTRLRLTLYTALDRSDRGVDVFLDWIRRDGTHWSNHPTRDDVMREYNRIWALLGGRPIEDLLASPLTSDPDVLDTLDVFTEVVTPALFYDENLSSLVVCRMVSLSLEHGNCDGSCFGYTRFAMLAGPRFGNYKDGYRFGQLGFDLVEKRGLTRYQARTYIIFSNAVIPWMKHVASGRDLARRAFDLAYQAGDLTYAAYKSDYLVANYFIGGDALVEVQTEAEKGLAFAKKARIGLVVDLCRAQLGLIRTLRGMTSQFGCFNDRDFNEAEYERHLASNPMLSLAKFFYWTRKLQGRFYAGEYEMSVAASLEARRLLWVSPSQLETADFRFYGALANAASWNSAASDDRRQTRFEALLDHHRQLEIWATHCPENFENRAALVAAEIARIEGREIDAELLYEKAIRSAHENGFVHNEGVANEVAARFYRARGFAKIAKLYLEDAHRCYLHWGADGKARHLSQSNPGFASETASHGSTNTILTSVEQLDLATVIKVSQAVSGEIVLENLINTLMRTAIEHAGADRGLLVLPQGDGYLIEAEVTSDIDNVKVDQRKADVTAAALPESVFRYALRTKEGVLLHDACSENPFSADDYIRAHHPRSILCLPILKQTRLLGMLYLENRLTPSAFTPDRMAILKLLASGAAISLENARLYRDLAEREARIRRLVDANIIGIFFWDLQGRILETNDAFLMMVGYERDDFASRRLCWTDLTPPESLEIDPQELGPKLKMTGGSQPFERELYRKDGSRVPVLIGIAALEERGNEGVAFVLDLTELKRAGDALRGLQMELTHASRLATMGQLTASIAHEVNQPIGAARNNAHAALRFLAADPPDLVEVKEALECVVTDTFRAGDIISGIRDQLKKMPPRKARVDLNAAIEEVIALVRGELSKHRVSVQIRRAVALSRVHGDRVQLQQVMLNLILNAIEAMSSVDDEERRLVVSTESSSADGTLVAVCDSGPGVPPEDLERIFESFYTTKAGGVGIGLSICRSIIAAHGGRLWADAIQPRGAAFRFTLPGYA